MRNTQINTLFITGGAGFIGSALIRLLIRKTHYHIVNIDKLTYAGNLDALEEISENPRYHFVQLDIIQQTALDNLFNQYQPCGVIHLAAESHVDNSICGSEEFIKTNIVGTYTLLEATRKYWQSLSTQEQSRFRFHHVSTDEVFGDLSDGDKAFTEDSPYAPSNPYSASKASSDHLVRAWHRTYQLPTIISHSSNNYGSYQNSEKLIPLTIKHAIDGQKIPIYGTGTQIRDWLYVEDHVCALLRIFEQAEIGQTYNIGGGNERQNIEVVRMICQVLDALYPPADNPNTTHLKSYTELITFVADRAGHDVHYAMNSQKIKQHLGWQAQENFEQGIHKTIKWYLKQNYIHKIKYFSSIL